MVNLHTLSHMMNLVVRYQRVGALWSAPPLDLVPYNRWKLYGIVIRFLGQWHRPHHCC